jgi:hypothetical protein
MNRAEVHRGITRSWSLTEALSLHSSFAAAWPLSVDVEFRDLVLSGDADYPTIYLKGLSRSHYNFLLIDYSYFQFSWFEADNVRYAYYPNPYLVSGMESVEEFKRLQELVESDMITYEEYLALLRDRPYQGRVPLIRYENAPNQYRELCHPCSHFHIGLHAENRWPLNRMLTPYAFTMLILKHYYGEDWREHGDDEGNEFLNSFDETLVLEKSNCPPIPGGLFSEKDC